MEEEIARASEHYFVFAFDEGTPDEIRAARDHFNAMAEELYEKMIRLSVISSAFHRPTKQEFRSELMQKCREILRKNGRLS